MQLLEPVFRGISTFLVFLLSERHGPHGYRLFLGLIPNKKGYRCQKWICRYADNSDKSYR